MSKHNTPEARWQRRNEFKRVDPFPKGINISHIPDHFQTRFRVSEAWSKTFAGLLTFSKVQENHWELIKKELDEESTAVTFSVLWSRDNIQECRKNGTFVGPYIILKDPEHIIPII